MRVAQRTLIGGPPNSGRSQPPSAAAQMPAASRAVRASGRADAESNLDQPW
jgi:hypothetical protein